MEVAPRLLELGPHTMQLRADGICVTTLVGVLESPEADRFAQEMRKYQEQHPNAILILDMTRAESVRPESRKLIIAGVRARPYPVCFIKASFALRALMGLMLNAIRILGTPMPHAFVDTEDEALAWGKQTLATWKPEK